MENGKKVIAQKYFEAFYNANDSEKAKSLASELLSDDLIDHSPAFGATPDKTGMLQTVGSINHWFKQNYKVEKLIQEDDLFVGIWKSDVTHVAAFMGVPPTNKTFTIQGITVYQIKNEKIVAHWEQFDVQTILINLGISKN